ncbi:HAD family hydrolase [Nannocystis pusilla]|uniref:HAD family hydrolase n=1 Tax=Nannocystis pusilla TaxID=889268 RepID=UPI003B832802
MEAGVALYIVSSSPHEIVALLAADLGVTDCDGSRFAARDGRYTGDCHSMPGALGGKLTLLRQFAAARGASLSRSLALGNGPGDIEVLGAVGRPLVFEAGPPLSAIARTNNWPRSIVSMFWIMSRWRWRLDATSATRIPRGVVTSWRNSAATGACWTRSTVKRRRIAAVASTISAVAMWLPMQVRGP